MEAHLRHMLHQAFAQESRVLLERLRAALRRVRGEDGPVLEILTGMARDLHTLKGASTTVGLETIAIVCQALEELTRGLVNSSSAPDQVAVDTIVEALKLIEGVCAGEPDSGLATTLHDVRLCTREVCASAGSRPSRRRRITEVDPQQPPRDSGRPRSARRRQITEVDLQLPPPGGAGSGPRLGSGAEHGGVGTSLGEDLHRDLCDLRDLWEQLRGRFTASPRAQPVGQAADEVEAFSAMLRTAVERAARLGRPPATPLGSDATHSLSSADSPAPTGSILVVDDSATARAHVRDVLEAAGYMVYVAVDGQEALALLPALGRLDLLVTDLQMPRMDGTTLCRRVRTHADFSGMPIVVVTTRDDTISRDASLSAGADAYITKHDFGTAEFLDTVGRLLSTTPPPRGAQPQRAPVHASEHRAPSRSTPSLHCGVA